MRYDESPQIKQKIEIIKDEFKADYVYFRVFRVCAINHKRFIFNRLRDESFFEFIIPFLKERGIDCEGDRKFKIKFQFSNS